MQPLCYPLRWPIFCLLGLLTSLLNAEVKIPAIDTSTIPPTMKGRILIEELNCVACHHEPEFLTSSKQSPRLSGVGSRLSPEYIKSFLMGPSIVKPGTLMPDLLSHLKEDQKEKIAESITHYLISLNKKKDFKEKAPDSVAAEKGNYRHFMQKEIHEQVRAITDTIGGRIDFRSGKITLPDLTLTESQAKNIDRIVITACGTAAHAGMVGKTLIEELARIPVEVSIASAFRY